MTGRPRVPAFARCTALGPPMTSGRTKVCGATVVPPDVSDAHPGDALSVVGRHAARLLFRALGGTGRQVIPPATCLLVAAAHFHRLRVLRRAAAAFGSVARAHARG